MFSVLPHAIAIYMNSRNCPKAVKDLKYLLIKILITKDIVKQKYGYAEKGR